MGEPRLARLDYQAAGGREVMLYFADGAETLFGLLRLRLQPEPLGAPGNDGGPSAVVRELHVYGPEVPLDGQVAQAAQHRGLGRALLQEAEDIAAGEFGTARLAVLSGVGAREYYVESGYMLQGGYMVKRLAPDGRAGNQ